MPHTGQNSLYAAFFYIITCEYLPDKLNYYIVYG